MKVLLRKKWVPFAYTLNLSNYHGEVEQQICEESYKMSSIKMKSNKDLLRELQKVQYQNKI